MAFLRTGSTRRVVGVLLSAAALLVVLAVVAGVALGGGGAAPAPKPLAQAIHDSLTAPAVAGVTARVEFTSHLFDGMTTDTSSALMKGGSGRLWLAPGKLRVELQSDNGDAQIVYADGKGFVYDGPSNTAYTFAGAMHKQQGRQAHDTVPTVAQIETRIAKAKQHVSVGDPSPEVVAGQPAYEVRVTPHDSGGLVGAAQLAWDASHGVPLDVAIYARGATTAALELKATDISFGAVDPSVFDLTPPSGANVVDLGGGRAGAGSHHSSGKQAAPSFSANAPGRLGPRARRDVKRAGDGYLVLYGKGLDTVAVLEHAASSQNQQLPAPKAQRGQPLDLPTVSVDGSKATAIGTPLGGVVSFEHGGISYTVVGSQPLSVLEDAARGL